MTGDSGCVRRATLEDLRALRELWAQARLPVGELEKRLTEFQVVPSPGGALRACIALQVSEHQGKLHSEAYADAADRQALRAQLWERVLSVARNHGLYQIWTLEGGPFWTAAGFAPPNLQTNRKLPRLFGAAGQSWSVLKLRDELSTSVLSVEQEFELFKQSRQTEAEHVLRQARLLKTIACAMAIVVLLIAAGVIVYALRTLPREIQRNKVRPRVESTNNPARPQP